jgi:hypothetical protein
LRGGAGWKEAVNLEWVAGSHCVLCCKKRVLSAADTLDLVCCEHTDGSQVVIATDLSTCS